MDDILTIGLVGVTAFVILGIASLIFTNINIKEGPYNCIDIDNNTIICEQVWRSYGTLYGITEDGKTIDLKSYERIKE